MESRQLAWKIRRHGVEMTHLGKSSHVGAILSEADILAVLYAGVLNVNPKDPRMPTRDRFILSKGHAGAGVYAALAESGFFDTQVLQSHYQDGSILSGHVSHKGIPGVEVSTGSLGHGLPIALGMALAAKRKGEKHFTYVLLGDGECDEGAVWEAALIANHNQVSRLIIVIDHNKMQSLDFCENTVSLAPFKEKWQAFGLNALEVDGHDHDALKAAFSQAKANGEKGGSPTVIIANTIKGKGISFMENNILWHYRTPQNEEYDQAVRELEADRP